MPTHHRRRRLAPFLATGALLLAPLPALAQTAPPAAHAAAAPLPDIVRTKDGGFVRGTILESIPQDHVLIQPAVGDPRRIAWSDVTYAGPANTSPSPTPAPPTPPPPPAAPAPAESSDVPVRFEGDGDEELRLHVRVGESEVSGVAWGGRGAVAVEGTARQYASVCTAPCQAHLPQGTNRLGLSAAGGRVIEASQGVRIDGPSVVHGHYYSYTGVRVAGWLVFAAGIVGGTALMVTSTQSTQDCSTGTCFPTTSLNTTQLALGGGVMGVGVLIGLAMAFKHDEAIFTVSPLTLSSLHLGPRGTEGALPPQGLALTARF